MEFKLLCLGTQSLSTYCVTLPAGKVARLGQSTGAAEQVWVGSGGEQGRGRVGQGFTDCTVWYLSSLKFSTNND